MQRYVLLTCFAHLFLTYLNCLTRVYRNRSNWISSKKQVFIAENFSCIYVEIVLNFFIQFVTYSFRSNNSSQFIFLLGRVRLESIRNKNNWNNASKRFSFRNTWIPAARSRIAGIYSRIYSYSGISKTKAALKTIATFRLEYEDDYEYEFTVLRMHFRLAGQKFSTCACSEFCPRTRSRPRTPIRRSLIIRLAYTSRVVNRLLNHR